MSIRIKTVIKNPKHVLKSCHHKIKKRSKIARKNNKQCLIK